MSRTPFIIRTHIVESAVPKDSEVYDQTEESKIQVLQAINGYLTVRPSSNRSTWPSKAARSCGPSGTTRASVPPSPTFRSVSCASTSSGLPSPTSASVAPGTKTQGSCLLTQTHPYLQLPHHRQLLPPNRDVHYLRHCDEWQSAKLRHCLI